MKGCPRSWAHWLGVAIALGACASAPDPVAHPPPLPAVVVPAAPESSVGPSASSSVPQPTIVSGSGAIGWQRTEHGSDSAAGIELPRPLVVELPPVDTVLSRHPRASMLRERYEVVTLGDANSVQSWTAHRYEIAIPHREPAELVREVGRVYFSMSPRSRDDSPPLSLLTSRYGVRPWQPGAVGNVREIRSFSEVGGTPILLDAWVRDGHAVVVVHILYEPSVGMPQLNRFAAGLPKSEVLLEPRGRVPASLSLVEYGREAGEYPSARVRFSRDVSAEESSRLATLRSRARTSDERLRDEQAVATAYAVRFQKDVERLLSLRSFRRVGPSEWVHPTGVRARPGGDLVLFVGQESGPRVAR